MPAEGLGPKCDFDFQFSKSPSPLPRTHIAPASKRRQVGTQICTYLPTYLPTFLLIYGTRRCVARWVSGERGQAAWDGYYVGRRDAASEAPPSLNPPHLSPLFPRTTRLDQQDPTSHMATPRRNRSQTSRIGSRSPLCLASAATELPSKKTKKIASPRLEWLWLPDPGRGLRAGEEGGGGGVEGLGSTSIPQNPLDSAG